MTVREFYNVLDDMLTDHYLEGDEKIHELFGRYFSRYFEELMYDFYKEH